MRLILLSICCSGSLLGWGCEGHQMVALIARAHLNAHASAAADDLLKANPVPASLKRFCDSRMTDKTGMADPMAADSTWADDVRNDQKNGPWHYIDIPRSEKLPDIAKYCPPAGSSVDGKDRPGCVASAIDWNLAILIDEKAAGADRADALRYVVHFVGDLHQPLHTTDNNDHGGNCTRLQFFDQDHPTNLHAVWDYNIIEHETAAKGLTVADEAKLIDQKFSADGKTWGQLPMDLSAWIWEGHAVANDVAYAKTAPPIPMETPTGADVCKVETQKVQDLGIKLGDAYQSAAEPVVEKQLARAGYRLAGVLNAVWK